jgi:hypothetical protein
MKRRRGTDTCLGGSPERAAAHGDVNVKIGKLQLKFNYYKP